MRSTNLLSSAQSGDDCFQRLAEVPVAIEFRLFLVEQRDLVRRRSAGSREPVDFIPNLRALFGGQTG